MWLLEKLRLFSFVVYWMEGKKHKIADKLSRAPVVRTGNSYWDPEVEQPVVYVIAALEAAAKQASK